MVRVFVAGHRGMVGSAICRRLVSAEDYEIIVANRSDLDLCDQHAVRAFIEDQKVDHVYLAAARVGGIHANDTYPAEFIYENLMIQSNVIHSAYRAGVQKLLFLGSSCIFPKLAEMPLREEALLTGLLEPTNEPYAIAKIAGIKMCEAYRKQYGVDYRSVMPTNLYGLGDNYHPENSHVLPALITRFHAAKLDKRKAVTLWGSGSPMREFLYADDLAEACIHVLGLAKSTYESLLDGRCSFLNVGSGKEISIKFLADMVRDITGFSGSIEWDASKPDGTPRKIMDSNRLRSSGWQPKISFLEGLKLTYEDYLGSQDAGVTRSF